ncbi:MAG: D-2-hydroxyacid dehydrogenase [Bacillota bacterium]|jgi:glycerate dehydrogenase
MKIVVLDGYTLNPGDLSWDDLKKLGEVTLYDHTPPGQILERARGAAILFTNKTPLQADDLAQLDGLKYIGVLATGYNVVDVAAARERNIVVTNIPTYGTRSVAQMVFALLLAMTQHVKEHSEAVFNGEWTKCRDFCFWKYPLIELAGKTMGIIGFGRIGQTTADLAAAFGMNVIGYDSFQSDQSRRVNFKWAGLAELLAEADVVSLHCPLFPETKGMINRETLKLMKSTAFLINTSRGPLVVEEDLAAALNRGQITGAALDVLAVEPPPADSPLFTAKNCLITPHISWATREARARLMAIAVDNLQQFLTGRPVNVVNR